MRFLAQALPQGAGEPSGRRRSFLLVPFDRDQGEPQSVLLALPSTIDGLPLCLLWLADGKARGRKSLSRCWRGRETGQSGYL